MGTKFLEGYVKPSDYLRLLTLEMFLVLQFIVTGFISFVVLMCFTF